MGAAEGGAMGGIGGRQGGAMLEGGETHAATGGHCEVEEQYQLSITDSVQVDV